MSAGGRRGGRWGRRRRALHGESEDNERWLLTYADMITLLMALFMVLFAMSSVDSAKYESLQHALQNAFSGRIMPGGEAVRDMGSTQDASPAPEVAISAIQPLERQLDEIRRRTRAASEADDFERLKRQIDAYANEHHLSHRIETIIERRGLVVRLRTDRVLFATGSADLQPAATPLLARIAGLLRSDFDHPILVEGHTDDVPISESRFPTNWELSGSRAATVVRFLVDHDVPAKRLAATGYGEEHPIDTNATATGRARNRRVELVLSRIRTESTTEGMP
ncbi:MAG: OmpA family protein [Solirubrobacteraceae bacterium]|nr:OmpA family protein [Solirubrobacteraceae bacterium]